MSASSGFLVDGAVGPIEPRIVIGGFSTPECEVGAVARKERQLWIAADIGKLFVGSNRLFAGIDPGVCARVVKIVSHALDLAVCEEVAFSLTGPMTAVTFAG